METGGGEVVGGWGGEADLGCLGHTCRLWTVPGPPRRGQPGQWLLRQQ
jgi:hypothetical protein